MGIKYSTTIVKDELGNYGYLFQTLTNIIFEATDKNRNNYYTVGRLRTLKPYYLLCCWIDMGTIDTTLNNRYDHICIRLSYHTQVVRQKNLNSVVMAIIIIKWQPVEVLKRNAGPCYLQSIIGVHSSNENIIEM